MSESKLKQANAKIAEGVAAGFHKIEDGVVEGYKKIENGVVGSYKKIEDAFVDKFLTHEGESTGDAQKRPAAERKEREDKAKAAVEKRG